MWLNFALQIPIKKLKEKGILSVWDLVGPNRRALSITQFETLHGIKQISWNMELFV